MLGRTKVVTRIFVMANIINRGKIFFILKKCALLRFIRNFRAGYRKGWGSLGQTIALQCKIKASSKSIRIL